MCRLCGYIYSRLGPFSWVPRAVIPTASTVEDTFSMSHSTDLILHFLLQYPMKREAKHSLTTYTKAGARRLVLMLEEYLVLYMVSETRTLSEPAINYEWKPFVEVLNDCRHLLQYSINVDSPCVTCFPEQSTMPGVDDPEWLIHTYSVLTSLCRG